MKTSFKLIALIWLVTIFTACKKEGAIVPQVNNTDSSGMVSGNLRANNGWLLTKQGNTILEYIPYSNKLKKVTHADGSVTNYSYGYTSSYSFIIGECMKNGVSLYKVTYYIDASGKAYQMKYKSDLSDLTYNLFYQNGRLIEQKRNYGAETYKFQYDNESRLSKIDYYGSDGIKKQSFQYIYFVNPMVDSYSINPEEAFLDRYLPIFGTFSKHLPDVIMPLDKPGFVDAKIEYHFNYKKNAYGLVSERKKWKYDWNTNPAPVTLEETLNYEYQAK
jgi:hypothetical protein